jgi:hypothetical protein
MRLFYTVSRGDFVAQEQEIDVRAQGILMGLGELRALLAEPITRHALDLTNNAKTASQHDILNRTHRSLTQYLKLEGDLFYVGLLGHFSTGKSSTISLIGDDRMGERLRMHENSVTFYMESRSSLVLPWA